MGELVTQEARLEQWSIGGFDDNPYAAPETRVLRLFGNAYGHPNFPHIMEGELIQTSAIQAFDWQGGTVATRNTIYTLGEIDPKYHEWLKNNQPESEALTFVEGEN